jgi:hypothetical protein
MFKDFLRMKKFYVSSAFASLLLTTHLVASSNNILPAQLSASTTGGQLPTGPSATSSPPVSLPSSLGGTSTPSTLPTGPSATSSPPASLPSSLGGTNTPSTLPTGPSVTSSPPASLPSTLNVSVNAAQLPSSPNIMLLPLDSLQKAMDNGALFVVMSDNSTKVVCVSGNSIGKIQVGTTPVCKTINPSGGAGPDINDNFKGIVLTTLSQWKGGNLPSTNWYTPSGQAPSGTTITGICGVKSENGTPSEIGVAVSRNNQCVFQSKSVPLSDPTILILSK